MQPRAGTGEPLVCILTPVYNGEQFIEGCVASVRAQTYGNVRHIIVDNRSTDRTGAIAARLAADDPRLEVVTNTSFVSLMDNHNIALRLTPPEAKYCKVLSADDELFPEFLERMVAMAERHPSAGFVGCYQVSGAEVRWQGFEYPQTLFDGRALARRMFASRDPSFGFGTPTSLLYRADLVRSSDAFYPNTYAHADTSVFYRYLAECDYAFVHQVLCMERLDPQSATPRATRMREELPGTLSDLKTYGHLYMSPAEQREIEDRLLQIYHKVLLADVLSRRDADYLAFHRRRLAELGHPLTPWILAKAAAGRALEEIANPLQLARKVSRRLSRSGSPRA